jgi:hypothetical protein
MAVETTFEKIICTNVSLGKKNEGLGRIIEARETYK